VHKVHIRQSNRKSGSFGRIRRVTAAALRTGALALVLGLAQTGSASAQEKITLSLATWGASSHPQVKVYAHVFMDEVTKRTNGQVEWKFFPDDTLVKQAFVPSAVPGGQVDISLTTLDSWAGRIPQVSIAASPLWTLTMEESQKALAPGQPLFVYFDKLLEKQNTKLLSLFDIGAPAFFCKFACLSPESMRGHTMRGYSKGASESMKAVGIAPVTMGVADVYSALQRGAIDGALGGLQGAYGLKHYEVTDHVLGSGGILGALVNGFVMNKARFEKLPPNVQKAILEANLAASEANDKELERSYQAYLADLKAKGLTVNVLKPGTPEWKAWSQALGAHREELTKKFPAELVAMTKSSS
jgi:TRAP-type C4-dicarboxylate transport system substrate-binding protein